MNIVTPIKSDDRSGISLTARIMLAIADNYDERERCYANGATDASIAAKIKAAPQAVARVRGEHFGPAEKPKPLSLEDRVAKLEARIAALEAGRVPTVERATASEPGTKGEDMAREIKALLQQCSGKWLTTREIADALRIQSYQIHNGMVHLRRANAVDVRKDVTNSIGVPMNRYRLRRDAE